jgi:multisubunit Na+/H+ antiporter MnhB subunit
MLAQIFTDKALLIVVTVIGMAACAFGIRQVAQRGEWLNPMAILASIIGALILVIVAAALINLPLPLIDSARTALFAVVLLALLKVIATQLHRIFA